LTLDPHPPSDPLSTSVSLLEKIKQRDQEAWERWVHIYSPLIYYWCRREARLQPADAAEVFQEVCCAVAGNISAFQKTGSFRGWLRTITRNAIRDHFRRKATEPDAFGGSDALQHFQTLHDPESEAEQREAALTEETIVVRRALDVIRGDFHDHTWKAFWRTCVDGVPTSEVAEELSMTESAIRQGCYRVRRKLREELDGLLES